MEGSKSYSLRSCDWNALCKPSTPTSVKGSNK